VLAVVNIILLHTSIQVRLVDDEATRVIISGSERRTLDSTIHEIVDIEVATIGRTYSILADISLDQLECCVGRGRHSNRVDDRFRDAGQGLVSCQDLGTRLFEAIHLKRK
jgi:hypothetical protein